MLSKLACTPLQHLDLIALFWLVWHHHSFSVIGTWYWLLVLGTGVSEMLFSIVYYLKLQIV